MKLYKSLIAGLSIACFLHVGVFKPNINSYIKNNPNFSKALSILLSEIAINKRIITDGRMASGARFAAFLGPVFISELIKSVLTDNIGTFLKDEENKYLYIRSAVIAIAHILFSSKYNINVFSDRMGFSEISKYHLLQAVNGVNFFQCIAAMIYSHI